MFGLGAGEILIILAFALIFIGPKKLPELAKGLGKSIREFQKAKDELLSQVQAESEEIKEEVKSVADSSASSASSMTQGDEFDYHDDPEDLEEFDHQNYDDIQEEHHTALTDENPHPSTAQSVLEDGEEKDKENQNRGEGTQDPTGDKKEA